MSNNHIYMANRGTNGDHPSEPTSTDVEYVVAQLLQNDVPLNDGDGPIGIVTHSYFGFIQESNAWCLKKMRTFVSVKDYPSHINSYKKEIGTAGNMRFITRPDSDPDIPCAVFSNKSEKIYQIICMPIMREELFILCCEPLSRAKHYKDHIALLYTLYPGKPNRQSKLPESTGKFVHHDPVNFCVPDDDLYKDKK
jgi:hypothetical protein